ncbi:MAG: Uma2 family endonuclease [Acetobacteraceae bacterium]|nr:Uma2 family endonuclease [Acetobacteraceae bacterium]
MTVALRETWTIERFLAWEDAQEGRHEFDGRRIVEATGGTRAHQRIVSNLIRALEDALDPERFDAVPEMRLAVGGSVRYPDVTVVAGRVPDAERTLRDALVLFEVVSPDSLDLDHGAKRAEYAGLPSIRRYVILEQTRAAATVLERQAGGWVPVAAAAELAMPELGITLPLAAVYRGVRFG